MFSLLSFFLFGWVVGCIMVAANPSPYFGALGLVFMAGMGGSIVLLHGGAYFCLVLFLVYLGGMLVAFGYTSAMAADPYPETLGSLRVFKGLVTYFSVFGLAWWIMWQGQVAEPGDFAFNLDGLLMSQVDAGGVANMFSMGGWALLACGWGLLLALFVVMGLIRGSSRGALRVV